MDVSDDTAVVCMRGTWCGQVLQKPQTGARNVVLKVMQYLLHTIKWRITYGVQGCGVNIEAYTDSKFGACLDT